VPDAGFVKTNNGVQNLREVFFMSERKTEIREKEWDDVIPDPEEEFPEADEETYRDGSVKNECWSE